MASSPVVFQGDRYNEGRMKSRVLALGLMMLIPAAFAEEACSKSQKVISEVKAADQKYSVAEKKYQADPKTYFNEWDAAGTERHNACQNGFNTAKLCAEEINAGTEKLVGEANAANGTQGEIASGATSAAGKASPDANGYTKDQKKLMRGNHQLQDDSAACLTTSKEVEPKFGLFKNMNDSLMKYCDKPFPSEPPKSVNANNSKWNAATKQCTGFAQAAKSQAAVFAKNAAIVGGIGLAAGGLAFGLTKALGDKGDNPDSNKAAQEACEKNTGMVYADGVCKSKTAMNACPDGFTKDKDGYCVMNDANGTPLETGKGTAASANSAVKIATPDSTAKKEGAMSEKDKALAGLKGDDSAGDGSGGGAAGALGAEGAGGSGGGAGKGAGAGGAVGKGGGGSGYSGSGGGSGENGEDKTPAGEAKQASDNPLRWRNSRANDRDLPISRRKRLNGTSGGVPITK
jgi:hypothetical protein